MSWAIWRCSAACFPKRIALAWHDAQLGDYFQNGGYGSILISYMPGALGYTREEDTLLSLSAAFDGGRLELMTMRRYTPGTARFPA
ncbi:MAG: hypothetical protein ACLUHE_14340 [Christensenellales bacterium]